MSKKMTDFKSALNGGMLFLIMGGLLCVASAQSSTSTTSDAAGQSSAKMSAADKTFVKKAAEGGLAEVELGKLATEKAGSEQVKQFGQRMVNDHSKANDQLKQVAQSQGITLPTEPNAMQRAEKERLSKLSGEQFDKAYMSEMLKDHKKDIAEFRTESKSAQDRALKDFASQTLPTLQSHLKDAESIAPSQGLSQRSSADEPRASK
jgi:putative membrane protein